MAGHGGKRAGAGRKKLRFGFRSWCRDVVSDPAVQETIKQRALVDADFALKLADHGYGRPPASLEMNVTRQDDQSTYRAEFEDGSPLRATGS